MIIKTIRHVKDGRHAGYYEGTPPGGTISTGVPALTLDGIVFWVLASPESVRPVDVVERFKKSAANKLTEQERKALGI